MSEGPSTPGATPDTLPKMSLTRDQSNHLLSLIDVKDNPSATTLKPNPSEVKVATRWPEWDGSKELYRTFIEYLASKIEVDWDILGGHRAVCSEMMNTIPNECKIRVSNWFSTGGPDNDWNYETFVRHFNEVFEDKTSARAASVTVSMMRQGQDQIFSDLLRDFEYTLAQAKGLNWEGQIKVIHLSLCLNDRLPKALVFVSTSDDNYTLYVNKLREVSGKIESRDKHGSRRAGSQTKTWFINRQGGPSSHLPTRPNPPISYPQDSAPSRIDADGDTVMSGINGVSASTLSAIINAVKSQISHPGKQTGSKPPAPWRSPEEFAELRAAGKCTRCGEKGHWYKRCPRFTWSKRHHNINAASIQDAKNTSKSDSDDEDCGSGKE